MVHRFVFLFACLPLACLFSNAQEPAALRPMFAKQASLAKRVVSPDGKATVTLHSLSPERNTEFPVMIEADVAGKKLTTKIFFGLNTEVLWSPDSKAFAISGSSEGANGQYWTEVFLLESDRLVPIPLAQSIRSAFGHPVKCGWPEYPNIAAVAWVEPSTKVLVAAEIIHHSNCDSFGTFRAYEVRIPSKRITKTYYQLEAKKLFGKQLGEELSTAPDKCVVDPKKCYVEANHP